MSGAKSIVWFRQDLRIKDNPALLAATEVGEIIPVYILDEENAQEYSMGGASKWWLHESLKSLNKSLDGKLNFYKGDARKIIKDLCEKNQISHVFWNRCYEPWRISRDSSIKSDIESMNIEVKSFNASLLWEPWTIKKDDGTPYKVFTPFYRKGCLNSQPPREPLGTPKNFRFTDNQLESSSLDDLNLIPEIDWYKQMEPFWEIGEEGALNCFNEFLDNGISNYKDGRNFPAKRFISRLSPYLHFGEISVNYIWHEIRNGPEDRNIDHFCSELGWREFSYSQLFTNPDLPVKNLQSKFDNFPWVDNDHLLKAWQKGLTGIPMVDAGMRELWQTGYMHNRVRMVVGSFLVKNLLLDWRHGERWFWDTLVDADLANNSASWQWVAGCGADAAPYFRIFNCVTQGEKFDPDGDYIRHYIPELKNLNNKYLYSPWTAPSDVLSQAGIQLGKDYPNPIVDLSESRNIALDAFKSIGQKS